MNEERYYTGDIREVEEVKFVLDYNGTFNYQRKNASVGKLIKKNALLQAYDSLPGIFYEILPDGKLCSEIITAYPRNKGDLYVEKLTIKSAFREQRTGLSINEDTFVKRLDYE